MSDLELARLTLDHLKDVTLPGARAAFQILEMNAAHDMIEALEDWIADPQGAAEAGVTQQMRGACIVYCAHNLHR